MARVCDLTRFRAAGVRLDWMQIGRQRDQQVPDDQIAERVDVRLVWGCAPELGVPRGPFTVWSRTPPRPHREIDLRTMATADGQWLIWPGDQLATLLVHCAVIDEASPVGLYLFRVGFRPGEAIAATVVDPAGRDELTIAAQAAGAVYAVLINARALSATGLTLKEVVDGDDWEELEIVGLPVGEAGLGAYDTRDQGMVPDLLPPAEAAVQRVRRAGPALGWPPYTETWRPAPDWIPPQPEPLVAEVTAELLPQLDLLYSPGLPEREQLDLVEEPQVDPPSQDRGRVKQDTKAELPLLGLLGLASGAEPFVNLATGFGTGYRTQDLHQRSEELEFLVTADYEDCVLGREVQVAAYVPPVEDHMAVPPVVDLTAGAAALLPPPDTDEPYRESIELSWRPRSKHATLTAPLAAALAGFDPGGAGQARDLLRPSDWSRPWATVSEPVDDMPDGDRPRLVDADQPLPLQGSVTRGYAVAQVNVFGLWSAWRDVSITTTAPAAPGPRLVRLDLSSNFVGLAVCPSKLDVEVAVPWRERTPERVEVYCVYYPMPTGQTPPPAGAAPGVAPAGTMAASAEITFSGDRPMAPTPGASVVPLREDGRIAPVPGPIQQGDEGRRYRLTMTGPDLDFSTVSRWGAQVWARTKAAAIVAPSGWSPAEDQPATTSVASPVPAIPTPPPLPPDVPLASTPDAQGRSHVKVTWSGLDGPHVDRVVIWECSETVLRERLAPPGTTVNPAHTPGQRLAELWSHYDAATPPSRRNTFRRLTEVPPNPTSADLELPRGSRDIHFFVATAVTTTGLESPWPDGQPGTPAHAHLQAAIAPLLRRPAIPLVTSAIRDDGQTELRLRTASPIEVVSFEVFATRSEGAARDHLTMGPPVATIPAASSGENDPVTTHPIYEANWPVTLAPSWDNWLLRVVAVPVPTVGPKAERGLVSQSSEILPLSVAPGPPHLDPLTAEVIDATNTGVLVRTSTSAPDHAVPAGSHRLVLTIDGHPEAAAALDGLRVGDGSTAPEAATRPSLERLPRSDGRTGLLAWLHRPDPAVAVEVAMRLTDPRGRSVEQQLTVPAWIPPAPSVTITVDDAFHSRGRGWMFVVSTSADPDDDPAFVLRVLARRLGPPIPLPPIPVPPIPVPPTPVPPIPRPPVQPPGRPLPLPIGEPPATPPGRTRLDGITDIRPNTTMAAKFVLADVPTRPGWPTQQGITAQRVPGPEERTRLRLWVPMSEIGILNLEVSSPGSGSAQTQWTRPA